MISVALKSIQNAFHVFGGDGEHHVCCQPFSVTRVAQMIQKQRHFAAVTLKFGVYYTTYYTEGLRFETAPIHPPMWSSFIHKQKLTGMLTGSCAGIKIKLFLTLEGIEEVGVLALARRDWT